jgi:hypothetical protein
MNYLVWVCVCVGVCVCVYIYIYVCVCVCVCVCVIRSCIGKWSFYITVSSVTKRQMLSCDSSHVTERHLIKIGSSHKTFDPSSKPILPQRPPKSRNNQ